MSYDDWCRQHGCDHGHCPDGCEHPGPQVYEGKLVCGRCLCVVGVVSEMVPCTPETCED